MEHELPLYEEILLLALDDERGAIAVGSMYSYALAGAVIAELVMADRIAVEQRKRIKAVAVKNPQPTGDRLLDDCLARMVAAKRTRSIQSWVSAFAQMKMRDRIADRLRQKGVLRRAEGRILFIFSRTLYPTVNAQPEIDLVQRIRAAIFSDEPTDPRTAVVVGLAHGAGLLGAHFTKAELKERKQRIKSLAEGDPAALAATDAVNAAVAATMAATTAATTAATVAATSG